MKLSYKIFYCAIDNEKILGRVFYDYDSVKQFLIFFKLRTTFLIILLPSKTNLNTLF